MQQDLDITVFNFEFNFPGKFLGCILHMVYGGGGVSFPLSS